MRLTLDARAVRRLRRLPPGTFYALARALLLLAIAAATARLLWMMLQPMGPVGNWSAGGGLRAVDRSILTRVDPFSRLAPVAGAVAVTSLQLKLFGVRLDQAAGRGSAIIATPDNVQNSYAVGDVIMPGVTLRSVAFDSVTIERNGVQEQIFLDQSKPSQVVQATGNNAAVTPPPPPAVAAPVALSPRTAGGRITGFTVGPAGDGRVFREAGLQAGDVVTAINGTTPTTLAQAQALAAEVPVSGIVTYTVERNGRTLTFNAQVPTQ